MPPRAVARLGSARFRYESNHVEPVLPAFTADSRSLVTTDGSNVYLWDANTGRAIRTWDYPSWGFVRRLTVSHDGKSLAVATTRGIWLTGLAAAGELSQLDRWPAGGQRHVSWNAFTPDDRALVSLDSADEIRVIDLKTKETRRAKYASLRALAGLSRDGKTLTICNQDTVDRCEIDSLRMVSSVQFPYAREIRKLRLSPDGSLLAANLGNGGVVFWDPDKQQEVGRIGDAKLISSGGMQFLQNGETLATVTRDEGMATVQIWNVATGKAERTLKLPSIESGDPILSPDGRTIAFAALSRNASVRDLQSGRSLCGRCGFDVGPTTIAFCRDGRVVAADDSSICVWDQFSGELSQQIPQTQRIQGLLVSADGKSAILSFRTGGLRQFDLQTGEVVGEFALPESVTIEHGPMTRSSDGRTIFVVADTDAQARPVPPGQAHRLLRWDTSTREPRTGWEIPPRSPAALFSVEITRYQVAGPYLAELTSDQRGMSFVNGTQIPQVPAQVVLRDLSTNRVALTVLPLQNPETIACNRFVLALVTRNQPNRMNNGDMAREALVQCWEIGTGEQIIDWTVPRLTFFAYSPDGVTLASSDDRTIEIRNFYDDGVPLRLTADSAVSCLSFSDDGRWLASGLQNGTILIWDVGRRSQNPSNETKLSPRQRAECWREMILDAKTALGASRRLVADPDAAIPFLREQLKPIASLDDKRIKSLLVDLDSPRYVERDAASRQLAALGERLRPTLETERSKTKSAEARNRLDRLLDSLTIARSPERARYVRSIIVLERIGNTEAAALLAELAKGDPDALETQLARDSLRRTQE